MQVTFVTKPQAIVGLPTAGFNSQGVCTHAKTTPIKEKESPGA